MDSEQWLRSPEDAYVEWQRAEATGADRRAFAEQSIVQHLSMFRRLNRYLIAHRSNVVAFGVDHIDRFFAELDGSCKSGTSTRQRYLKLIDRLARHLIALELRTDNPASSLLSSERWPEDEPAPVFLGSADDARLQSACAVRAFDSFKELRNASIVALLLGTGLTAAELRALVVEDLDASNSRMSVFVKKHGPRIARRVPVDAFAVDLLRLYQSTRAGMSCPAQWLFVSTANGTPMKTDRLGEYVRQALHHAQISAPDESPRLLRNTFGRRHLIDGMSNEQVSNLLGLSSHRTVNRLRQTFDDEKIATPDGSG
ncbi:site-specific integrase [Paraburkholderia sp. Tr-20389]|uniref:tyrosine-type recombinase/integrase n=1 Tax=Paraburkholderia sp. Tr-20389 TaxID=2703903 RepID=UPI00197DA647|nr:site-specific integrase [Paraburkholderia sp. Tr-20389]MBN3754218.1 site-specific integrase [Paraburkholderia sp. Tr-20389]